MDRQSVERLRFDSRLKNRDGWVDATKEEAYLASLPDVVEKMTTCAAEEDAAEAAAEEAMTQQRQPELEPQAPAPVAGDFSTQRYSPEATPETPSTVTPPSSDTSTSDALPDQGSAGTFRSEGGFGGDSNSN